MGFFSKIKDKLGIGGVNIDLTIPTQVAKSEGIVKGSIQLTTKSQQEIVSIKAILQEEFTQCVGDQRGTKTYELGKWDSFESFTINPGEVKTIPFELSFKELKSETESLIDRGGVFGTIGKLGKMAGREKSEYFVKIDVDVKSAVLDPTERKPIKLV